MGNVDDAHVVYCYGFSLSLRNIFYLDGYVGHVLKVAETDRYVA